MKCSNHPDKEASAICERCNLLYCGNCVLSSNGKCPKCGNTLRSPQSVMSYEISQSELYKGGGQPHLMNAINSLYMEPQRAMRRLREYPSLLTGVINVTILYLIVTILIIAVLLALVLVPTPSGVGVDMMATLLDVKTIFRFFIGVMLYYGFTIFGWLFSSFIYWVPAKLLGGKGEFVQQASVFSYMMLALFPLWLFSSVLAAIPIFGVFIAIAAILVVFFYSMYLIFLSILEIHEFGTFKAIASLLISIAIFLLLGLLLLTILLVIFAMPFIGNLPLPHI